MLLCIKGTPGEIEISEINFSSKQTIWFNSILTRFVIYSIGINIKIFKRLNIFITSYHYNFLGLYPSYG